MKKARVKKQSCGGRYTYVCPACQNADTKKMTTGQRTAYAECDCGFVWDAETGHGFNKLKARSVALDLEKLGN